MSRAEALSSSGVERAQEEKEVTGALKENGYPSSFVYKHSCPSRPRPDREERRPETTLTLPYISNLSEAIRRVLTPLDIQVVFRPLMTLRQLLVHPKDRVPMDEQKGVVYSIPCTECPKVYIGQTGRSPEWLPKMINDKWHDVTANGMKSNVQVEIVHKGQQQRGSLVQYTLPFAVMSSHLPFGQPF